MNPVTLCMDGLLAVLLVAALATGLRLNVQLKALRAGQTGFIKAVADLDAAAAKADRALSALHAATEETHDALLARIETARALTLKLEKAGDAAHKAGEAAQKAALRAEEAAKAPALARAAAGAPRAAQAFLGPQETSGEAPARAEGRYALRTGESGAASTLRRTFQDLMAAREGRSASPSAPLAAASARPEAPGRAEPSIFAEVRAAAGLEPRPVSELPSRAPARAASPSRRRRLVDDDLFADDDDAGELLLLDDR